MSSAQEGYMALKAGMEISLKNFVEKCIVCGRCLEVCPVFSEPKLELAGKEPAAVMEKIVDLLKGGPPSEEVYRMAYGCSMGCTNICKPACPEGLDLQPVFMALGHRLREEGEGLPPLSFHHAPGHRYGFGHIFGDLQMKSSEAPWLKEAPSEPETVDVVLFVSCVAQGMPHLVLESIEILRRMGIKFVAIGARDLCCGIATFMTANIEEAAKVSEKYVSTLSKFGANKVVSICCTCSFWGNTMLPQILPVPFESLHITEFLLHNIDKLSFTHPLDKVVAIHDSCTQRQLGKWDISRRLLQAIPGISLVEMEHNKEHNICCGAMTDTNFPGAMDARHFARLDEAMAAGADVMMTVCPGCQQVFCAYENKYPFEIKNAVTLVAEALGIHYEDKLKKYLAGVDAEQLLNEAIEYVEASDLSLLEFRNVLPGYLKKHE